MSFTTAARIYAEQASRRRVVLVALGLLFAVVGADIFTGSQVSFSFFYVLPLALMTWRFGGRTWVFGSVIAATIWFSVDAFTRPGGALIIPMWNAVIRAAFFLSITGLLMNLQAALRRETDLANFDALTGLPNRRALRVAAERELARTQRSGEAITFVMIDLDGLKKINDTAGHAAGDEAIRAAGHVVFTSIRRSDIAARIGGDEFALMLLGPEPRVVLERILERIAEHSVAGHHLNCSIGAATVVNLSLEAALDAADEALYEAKRAGKGQIVFAEVDAPQVEAPPAIV
ncbi:MAG: GGDEF domain-containing protein [Acidimicrobiia bacterium]|nr:GGDEF domain-containing protein [Acidimicrobiia bacterium]NNF63479.1 GGDEF domain-containing protein [Acidimicrobiia bacterium]